jgi:PAS domain S-box-containing protein
VIEYVRDITERKRYEEAVRESEERLKILFEFAPDAYYLNDLKGKFIDGNKAAEAIIGYKRKELIEKSFLKLKLISLKQIPKAAALLVKNALGQSTGPDEFILNRKDGTQVPVEIRSFPVKIKDQALVLAIARDITERKQAEKEREMLYDELKSLNLELEEKVKNRTMAFELAAQKANAANRAKSEFLASMSHELRTPLNHIIGFSEVLRDKYFGELNEKQADYIQDILGSGKHLLSLISDILDLSKIEAGKIDLELSPVNIKALLENSLVIIKEKAHEHGIGLDLKIPEEMSELEIQADERKLKQIMFNLLSNAAKFTSDGGAITLQADQKDEELIVSVEDTGIGIAPEDK